MKAKKPKPTAAKRRQADRATAAILEQRIQAVLQIRLDGAEGWDVRHYVAEKEAAGEQPWALGRGNKGLSERRIRDLVAEADKRIEESCRISRREALRRHKAQRRSLYARAVNAGDIRTALAVLADLATLQGLYPAARVKVKHKGGVKLEIVEEIVDAGGPGAENGPAASGAA